MDLADHSNTAKGGIAVSDVIESSYRSIFVHERFNQMQSIVLPQALNTDLNIVVAAPTGCGKTVIHELAIVRLLKTREAKNIKCLYIAPNKALCQQKASSWTQIFTKFGLRILELTGDTTLDSSLNLLSQASIIITTKLDSITRFWRNHISLLGSIDALLIDEVHHLNEDRGAVLETVVVRMRTLRTAYMNNHNHNDESNNSSNVDNDNDNSSANRPFTDMRMIALSATLPNVSDIGEWLHCTPETIHYFDESFRPVPLHIHVT
eukprot:gene4392-8741_t